jgi:hypothetical protein
MGEQKHRTQILLEPEQRKVLSEIAQQQDRSLSDLMRAIVSQYLEERAGEAERRRAVQALERLTALRRKIEQQSGRYQGDIVAETRAERERERGEVRAGQDQ